MDDQRRFRKSRISGPDSVAGVAALACATAAGDKSGARPWARIASVAKRFSSSFCAAVSVIVYGSGFARLIALVRVFLRSKTDREGKEGTGYLAESQRVQAAA